MSVLTADGTLVPQGYEQVVSLDTVKGLTPPAGARVALIQATGQNVRWRDDGTDPDAGSGMQLSAGKDFWYTGDLAAIKFIEETLTAELNVSYYGG